MYIINASWDVVTFGLIVSTQYILQSSTLTSRQAIFWVETKGRTLEEIDDLFEEEKSSIPDEAIPVDADVELVQVQGEKKS